MQSSILVVLSLLMATTLTIHSDPKSDNFNLVQNVDFLETQPSLADLEKLSKNQDQSNLQDIENLAETDDLAQKRKQPIRVEFGDNTFDISNRLRIDGMYGVNLRLLNDRNNDRDPQLDKVAFPGRHTWDMWLLYTYGHKSRGYEAIKFRAGIRNRGTWGNEANILPTTASSIKHVDAIIGDHTHAISRHVFWAREVWLEFVINDALGIKMDNRHTVTMGIFPFQLGRGISLGDAYDVDPDFLGFYTTNAIDQFAPAFKISGALIGPMTLTYDLYAEIADNLSETFDSVNQEINSQRFGRLYDPQRGFGIFDYILAARLQWRPFDKPGKKVYLEPYLMYSVDREQKIEFFGDANEHFATVGLAGEFEYGNWEAGFDTSFNVGTQYVHGWDRNIIIEENRNGFDAFVYSKIVTEKPKIGSQSPKALKYGATENIVNNTPRCQAQNGQYIGQVTDGTNVTRLYNALDRFTDPYKNELRGAMLVYDMAYKFPDIKLAATAGFATGDDDPNKDLQSLGSSSHDTTFKGFLGQQELYSGKRVRSLFVLAGPGRIPRLVSVPAIDLLDGMRPSVTNRFTNLILTGAGFEMTPSLGKMPVKIKPNVLGFWVWKRPDVYELKDGTPQAPPQDNPDFISADEPARIISITRTARPFLGIETNITLEAEIMQDLTYIFSGAIFFPGAFFEDLTGIPLNQAERRFLAAQANPSQRTPVRRVPTLGSDTAYFIQMAFEYKF